MFNVNYYFVFKEVDFGKEDQILILGRNVAPKELDFV